MTVSSVRGVLVVVLAVTLIGGLAACGDSEDGNGSVSGSEVAGSAGGADGERTVTSPGAPDRTDTAAPKTPRDAADPAGAGAGAGADADDDSAAPRDTSSGAPEARVGQVVTAMYRSFAAGDAAGVCRALSARARRDVAQQVPGGSTVPPERRTCRQSLGKFLEVAAQSGILERTLTAKVTNVEIDGTVATASVDIGGKPGDIRLFRESGRWVFGAPPVLRDS